MQFLFFCGDFAAVGVIFLYTVCKIFIIIMIYSCTDTING